MERLTLENAINRSRKLSERHRWNSENTKLETSDENANEVYKNTCIQYANQEEQYAEWLEELKSYKDIGTPKELKELKENGILNRLELAKLAIMQKELKKYKDLEEQGLLVRLPVKIGDDIYKIPSKANYDLNVLNGYKANNRVYHQKVYSIVFSQSGWFVQCDKDSIHAPNVICIDVEYGKTWFLTREEAEKKLEEMKK
jgi:hypothetical protein